MKKSLVANVIYTLILIVIAISTGIFLMSIIEKNQNSIKRNTFSQYFDISAYTNYHVQDPDYINYYLLSNTPTDINVIYYDLTTRQRVNKTYYVDGFKEINENLSYLFETAATNLDGHQIEVLIKNLQEEGSYNFAFSMLMKVAQRVLIVETNIPSYLVADSTYKLIPPTQILYIYNSISSIDWFDPYYYGSAVLPTAKVIRVIANENFNTDDYTIQFLDANTSNPIVNAKVYINSFFIGYTDNNGEITVKYHRNQEGYLRLEDQCYRYSELHRFYLSSETIYVNNSCSS
ncbi:MAG: hypothetical protein ABGW69_03185 [Nanoarchaeota archaeon]